MRKIPLEQLRSEFTGKSYALIVGLGFDLRCLSALCKFPLERTSHIVGISNARWKDSNRGNITEFERLTSGKGQIVGNNADTVMEVADGLVAYMQPIFESPDTSLIIDVTALSHELLVVIIGIFSNLSLLDRVTLLYVGASDYSFNTTDDAVWLSRGVRSIRSILGFPGVMLPSKRLHLIVFAGFEVERASEVILRYEPASLSIGLGKREQSVTEAHHSKNKLFFERLNQFIKDQDAGGEEIHHFEFSCIDPILVKNQLIAHIDEVNKFGERNIVVCPLNTKPSTVGVVLAAIERPEIQICYAEPDEYNTEGYSKPGTDVNIIPLNFS